MTESSLYWIIKRLSITVLWKNLANEMSTSKRTARSFLGKR